MLDYAQFSLKFEPSFVEIHKDVHRITKLHWHFQIKLKQEGKTSHF